MKLKFLLLFFLLSQNIDFAWGAAADFEWDEAPRPANLMSLANAHGLRIFWWNIHNGRIGKKPTPSLSRNLIQLIHSNLAPDIMVFGEYQNSSLSAGAHAELQDAYPYSFQWSYPPTPGYGQVAFSKYPMSVSRMEPLDFTPIQPITEAQRDHYREVWCAPREACTRMFVSLDINVGGKVIQLIPIHLFDGWRKYSQLDGQMETALEILFGKDNPVAFQLSRFQALLRESLKPALDAASDPAMKVRPTIVIGDFNIPKTLMNVKTRMYQNLAHNLVEVFKRNPTTFPAMSAQERGHYPNMEIDHAFLAGKLQSRGAEVLPLRGSDHYPISLVVSMDQMQ